MRAFRANILSVKERSWPTSVAGGRVKQNMEQHQMIAMPIGALPPAGNYARWFSQNVISFAVVCQSPTT